MKMKSFAMLAVSGLLTVACAYIAPAMADDTGNTDVNAAPSMPSDSTMQNGQNNAATGDSNSNNANSNASGSDEGSPDTATGDDDY